MRQSGSLEKKQKSHAYWHPHFEGQNSGHPKKLPPEAGTAYALGLVFLVNMAQLHFPIMALNIE